MSSTAPVRRRALSRFWEGLWMTFLAWSPPPEPLVTWARDPRRFPRLGAWLRSDTFSWLIVIAVFGIGLAAGSTRWGPSSAMAWISGLLAAVPFLLARHNLLVGWRAAAGVSAAVAITQIFLSRPGDGVAVMVAVVLPLFTFVVAATHVQPVGLWAWGVTVLIVSGVLMNQPGVIVLLGALLALITDQLRSRRLAVQELTEERERLGIERTRRVTVEERARIARELHDVVAHHMSMVAVRAETAPYRIDGLSPGARSELAEISVAARKSLDEIRGLLTVLRGEEAPHTPQPDLGRVEDLVEVARRAGADIDLHVSGRRRPLRAAVELSAYRILQESLANVTRHAPGESAEVWVDYGDDTLALMVTNPSSAEVGPPGHGMTGMRERASAVGGSVDARRRADGRFVVEASLPVKP